MLACENMALALRIISNSTTAKTDGPRIETQTIFHSTDSPNAGAMLHARGMAAGNFRGRSKWNRTGYMTWHFTVDDQVAVQSLRVG